MKCMRLLLALVFSFLSMASFAEKGDMWEVKDADLTVWDSPNYLTKLGMMHQGDTFEEEGMDGDMIKFVYKGKTAYVASYCCQRFEPEPDSDEAFEEGEIATENAQQESAGEKTEITSAGRQDVAQASSTDTLQNGAQAPVADGQQSNDGDGLYSVLTIPIFLLGLIGIAVSIVAIVFTFFYVFKYKTMAKWMNGKCSVEVIPYKRFNKLLLVPVLAALGAIAVTVLFGYLATTVEQGSNTQTLLTVIGCVLTIATPILSLWYKYKKDKALYGKKAARWMMVYSLLSIVAIYLVCVVIAYILIGIAAVLIFALIIALAFPTRYYIVREW